jgi:adenylate cyclase
MAKEGFKRKLTAILSTDVVGYSRLMQDNEEATIESINTHLKSISSLVEQHRGRVVDTTGDNLMAEFSSVVDAVQCAVEMQKEINAHNDDLPENRQMLFRIGVNLGDVVEEGDKIYGDGVNIAARLESLAEAGGICISRTAYGQVKNKLDLGYEYLGEHSVKNISEPVHVYKVLMEADAAGKVIGEKRKTKRAMALAIALILLIGAGGLTGWYLYIEQAKKIAPASVENMAYPLPDKPSIAVLPFDNMSGDPQQDHFSDGITEQIITSLSKVPYLFVIARNSTFAYKAKPVKISQVAEELGIQYVLEGSVQRSNDQVRITAQLIDAIAGHHIWAENYDRQIKDIFALQDGIAMKIMAELQVKLTVQELGRLSAIKTKNIKAYEKYLMGHEHFWRRTEGDSQQARSLAQEAISLDPEYGAAYQLLARTYLDDVWYYRVKSATKSLDTAEQLALKSIELSGENSTAHEIFCSVYYLRRQYDQAITECQKAIDLSPNSAEANYRYGHALRWAGRFDESITFIKKAIRLNPVTPMNYIQNLAWSYAYLEKHEKAISLWNKCIERNPDYFFAWLGLTMSYQLTGNEVKAREAAAEVMRLKPNLTISKIKKGPATRGWDRERGQEALRKAGIPP